MPSSELCWLSAVTLAALIRRREVSPVEVVEAHLDRIASTNGMLQAFLHVCPETALAEARQAESEIAGGNYRGPLHGLPVAYKDIIHVKGLPTTGHSRVMLDFVAKHDSAVAGRLRCAGAVTLGKLNTTEFASGGMEDRGFARNPWDTDRSPGTSSAGAGAAVAAGMTPLALGSDTGGSVRVPASFCGVLGLKSTAGRISRVGTLPVSSEMDCIGPMARTAADIALLLQILAGPHPNDPGAADVPVPDYTAALGASLAGFRLGVPSTYFFDHVDPEIEAAVRVALEVLQGLGATVHPVNLPNAEYAYAAHWCITYSETYLRWRDMFFTRRQDFGNVFVRKIASWAFLTSEELATGWRLRQVIKQDLAAALNQIDMLVTPTTPMVATPADSFVGTHQDTTRLTRMANVAGLPALAVPCGFTAERLPISLQLIGRSWDEPKLLRVAHAYELAAGLHKNQRPPLQPGNGPAAEQKTRATDGATDCPAPTPLESNANWIRAYADLTGLTFLKPEDFAPIAAQLAPIKSQLARARTMLSGLNNIRKEADE